MLIPLQVFHFLTGDQGSTKQCFTAANQWMLNLIKYHIYGANIYTSGSGYIKALGLAVHNIYEYIRYRYICLLYQWRFTSKVSYSFTASVSTHRHFTGGTWWHSAYRSSHERIRANPRWRWLDGALRIVHGNKANGYRYDIYIFIYLKK